MKYVTTGKIIKEFRERQGISQFELCEGLCEPPTLSKIETGKQNPNKKLLDALIARLHIPLTLNVPITKIEFERAQIEREIISKISTDDYDIAELLIQYKMNDETMGRLEKQFYLYADSIQKIHVLSDYSQAIKNLEAALQITFPKYTIGSNINKHLFIPIEITILNNIAINLYHLHKKIEAIKLMQQIIYCLENNSLEKEEYAKKYPPIAYNLSLWLGLEEKYDEALKIIDSGLKCSLQYERFSSFSRLLYNKGFSLIRINKISEGKKELAHSLFLLKILKKQKFFQAAKKDIIKNFGEIFWNELQTINLP